MEIAQANAGALSYPRSSNHPLAGHNRLSGPQDRLRSRDSASVAEETGMAQPYQGPRRPQRIIFFVRSYKSLNRYHISNVGNDVSSLISQNWFLAHSNSSSALSVIQSFDPDASTACFLYFDKPILTLCPPTKEKVTRRNQISALSIGQALEEHLRTSINHTDGHHQKRIVRPG